MTIHTKTFRRLGTDDVREFTAVPNVPSVSPWGPKWVQSVEDHYWADVKGERLDLRSDGTYRNKWGEVWVLVDSTESPAG